MPGCVRPRTYLVVFLTQALIHFFIKLLQIYTSTKKKNEKKKMKSKIYICRSSNANRLCNCCPRYPQFVTLMIRTPPPPSPPLNGKAGLDIDGLTRLEVHAEYAAAADSPAGGDDRLDSGRASVAGGTSRLELSRPAAAVLAGVLRSSQASKAAAAVVLSHLAGFRAGDGAGKRFVCFAKVKDKVFALGVRFFVVAVFFSSFFSFFVVV